MRQHAKQILRFFVCFMVCVSILFAQVSAPLLVPAQAVGPIVIGVAAAILGTILLTTTNISLQDPDFLRQWGAEMYNSLDDAGKAIVGNLSDQCAEWDGTSPYAPVTVKFTEFIALRTQIGQWVADHLSADGNSMQIQAPADNAPIGDVLTHIFNNYKFGSLFKSGATMISRCNTLSATYPNWLIAISKYGGDNVERKGNTAMYVCFFYNDLIVPPNTDLIYSNTYMGDFKVVQGVRMPAVGSTTLPYFKVNEGGGYNERKYYSSDGYYDLNLPVAAGHSNSGGEWLSPFYDFEYYANFNYPAWIARTGFSLDGTQIAVTGDVIDVPVERENEYAPGAVVDAWGRVIDRVGESAGELPFNVPMTDAGINSLTIDQIIAELLKQELAASKPAEGDTEMPDIKDLELPAQIIQKFPFCIPFDLYRGLSILNAPAVAPRFEIPLKIGTFVDSKIVLELTQFDFAIRMIRWCELILFMVALASATKNLISW